MLYINQGFLSSLRRVWWTLAPAGAKGAAHFGIKVIQRLPRAPADLSAWELFLARTIPHRGIELFGFSFFLPTCVFLQSVWFATCWSELQCKTVIVDSSRSKRFTRLPRCISFRKSSSMLKMWGNGHYIDWQNSAAGRFTFWLRAFICTVTGHPSGKWKGGGGGGWDMRRQMLFQEQLGFHEPKDAKTKRNWEAGRKWKSSETVIVWLMEAK